MTFLEAATGDGIIVDGVTLTNTVYTYNGSNTGTLALYAGTTAVETLTLAGNYTGRTFFISPTTSSASAILLLSNAQQGSSPVSTNSDSYAWIGSSGGSWDSAADWEDTTSGANPATSVPGSGNAVTIPGPTGSIYEVIDGGGPTVPAMFSVAAAEVSAPVGAATVTVIVADPGVSGYGPLSGGRSNVIESALQLVIVSLAPS